MDSYVQPPEDEDRIAEQWNRIFLKSLKINERLYYQLNFDKNKQIVLNKIENGIASYSTIFSKAIEFREDQGYLAYNGDEERSYKPEEREKIINENSQPSVGHQIKNQTVFMKLTPDCI